jgi:hypothetical protein
MKVLQSRAEWRVKCRWTSSPLRPARRARNLPGLAYGHAASNRRACRRPLLPYIAPPRPSEREYTRGPDGGGGGWWGDARPCDIRQALLGRAGCERCNRREAGGHAIAIAKIAGGVAMGGGSMGNRSA